MNAKPIVLLTSAIHPDEHARLAEHATVRVACSARRACSSGWMALVSTTMGCEGIRNRPL